MRQRHTIDAWGTKLYFDCEGESFDSNAAFAEIVSFVSLVDDLFSTYKPDSVVSQLRDGRMQIGDAPADVIEVAHLCAVAKDLTEGAFDPWAVPGGFDPSGYVKGWAADKCADIAQEHGAQKVPLRTNLQRIVQVCATINVITPKLPTIRRTCFIFAIQNNKITSHAHSQ